MSGAKLVAAKAAVDSRKYTLSDAIALLKSLSVAKFDESIDIAFVLGIDSRQSNENVRGSCELPHGTGRSVKVAVFAAGEAAVAAEKAGADFVGVEDLAEKFTKGEVEVDMVVASPDSMKVVGRLGPVLGPKGLMPNPKDGTVAADVVAATVSAKSGKIKFRNDKGGIIHCSVGRKSFSEANLSENVKVFAANLAKLKPAASKGKFFRKCVISTTMGPGVEVDLDTVL